MRRRSQSAEVGPIQQQARSSAATRVSPVLAAVQARFAEFRAAHPAGTEIPSELRTAALAARDSGVSAAALQRTCGVSWSQLASWEKRRRSDGAAVRKRSIRSRSARVFSVVDERAPDLSAAAAPTMHELELRVGPWAVSVRLADSRPARRS